MAQYEDCSQKIEIRIKDQRLIKLIQCDLSLATCRSSSRKGFVNLVSPEIEKYVYRLKVARNSLFRFSFHLKKKKIITRAVSIEFTDLDFEDRQKIAVKLTLTRYWRREARSSDARAAQDRHFKISFGI